MIIIVDYKILASGSSGNAVRIENLMVDCGIGFKDMKEELYKCKYLFITHIHKDHLKPSTIKRIKKEFPRIKILANYEVAQELSKMNICLNYIISGKALQLGKMIFTPFEVPHDVVCHGFTLRIGNIDVIYVTDSAGNKTWKKGKYDYLFIESNHDENKLRVACKGKYADLTFNNSKRHTSTQESKAFYYMNRKDKDSKWIELHKSKRFY